MRKQWIPGVIALAALAAAASASGAQTPQPGALLNRMSVNYRSLQSYRDTATWTRKVGSKEMKAEITLAAQKPNKFLLEVKGEKVNTLVLSDGNILLFYRPDRKAYMKTKAPMRLTGANVLSGVDLPTPGSRIVALLLQGNLREGDPDIAQGLANAQVSGPLGFGNKLAYVLTFRWDRDYDAKLYVTTDDFLLRRVTLIKEGVPEIVENRSDIEQDKNIPAETFVRTLPEDAKVVASLPLLEKVEDVSGIDAPDFIAEGYNGGKVRLSSYRGKVVIVDFWATWCGPCQRSMPHVEKVYQAVKSKDVVVLGVCVWDDRADYEKWVPENQDKYHFTFAFDPAGKDTPRSIAASLFKVNGIPTTLVIDKEGRLISKIVGYRGEEDRRIEAALKKLGIEVQ